MPFTSDQIADLENLKSLSTHIVSILDNESRIDITLRQLSDGNIADLNSLYGDVVQVINQIIASEITV
jgi:hypothetical protein